MSVCSFTPSTSITARLTRTWSQLNESMTSEHCKLEATRGSSPCPVSYPTFTSNKRYHLEYTVMLSPTLSFGCIGCLPRGLAPGYYCTRPRSTQTIWTVFSSFLWHDNELVAFLIRRYESHHPSRAAMDQELELVMQNLKHQRMKEGNGCNCRLLYLICSYLELIERVVPLARNYADKDVL